MVPLPEHDWICLKQKIDVAIHELSSLSDGVSMSGMQRLTCAHINGDCKEHWLIEKHLEGTGKNTFYALATRNLFEF